MTSTHRMLARSSRMLDDAYDALARRARPPARRPHALGEVGGVVAFALAVAVFIWIFPELRRYIRIERM